MYLRDGVVGHTPRFVSFVNRDGIFFELDIHDCIQRDIFCFHYYEHEDVATFRRLVRSGSVVFDVGANIGQYTLLASKLVGKTGRVYAFEPSPVVLKRLKYHLEMNHEDNVELVCKAVSDRSGTADFYQANESGNQGVGSLLPAESYRARARANEAIEVDTITLDDFCEKHGVDHIDVLKVDVEGFDLDVLKGAEKVLSRSPRVVVLAEVEPLNLAQRGLTYNDFIQYMHERGFRPYYAGTRGRLKPLDKDDEAKPNLFFRRT